jgi:quinol monooxygenase YgiN
VIAAFEQAIDRVTREDPGYQLYALHEGPDRLVMIEKYTSQDAASEHSKSPALAELPAALEGNLSSPLDVQILTPHPAGDPSKGEL